MQNTATDSQAGFSFTVEIIEGDPHIHISIPLAEYLLDPEAVADAKQKIEGITEMISPRTNLFVNQKPLEGFQRTDRLKDIIEQYKSLYLLKLLEDVLTHIKPHSNPALKAIFEKIQPLIEASKDALESGRYYNVEVEYHHR